MARNNGKSNGKAVDLGKQLVRVQKSLASKRSTLGQSIAQGTDVEFLADEINALERTEAAIQAGLKALTDLSKSDAAKSKVVEAEKKRTAGVRERLEANRLEEYRMLVLFLELRDQSDDLERQLGLTSMGRVPSVDGHLIRLLKGEVKRIYSQTPEALGGQHHPSQRELQLGEAKTTLQLTEKHLATLKQAKHDRILIPELDLENAEKDIQNARERLSRLAT